MAAEAACSGNVRTERKLFLTPTGLLMEGDYTSNPDLPSCGNYGVLAHANLRLRLAIEIVLAAPTPGSIPEIKSFWKASNVPRQGQRINGCGDCPRGRFLEDAVACSNAPTCIVDLRQCAAYDARR